MTEPAETRADWSWLDRVYYISNDENRAEASREFHSNEWYFAHHFRAFPVLPGVFIVEAMAHLAGVLQTLRIHARCGEWHNHVLLSIQDVRFYRYLRPEEKLVLKVEIVNEEEGVVVARCDGFVNGERTARGRIALHKINLSEFIDETAFRDPVGMLVYLDAILTDDLKRRYGLLDS